MTIRPTQRPWRKSSYSANTANCVEIADTDPGVLVRDSKLAEHSPILTFDRATWRTFLSQHTP